MTYLLIKIFFCLLLAGLLGAIIGWLFHKLIADARWKSKLKDMSHANEEADELLYNYKKQNKSLNSQVLQLTGKIKGKENDNLTLAKSFSKIRKSRQEVSNKLDTINNDLQTLRQSNSDLLAEKDELTKRLKAAKSENLEDAKKIKKQLASTKDDYTNLQSKLTDADIYIEQLERKQVDLNKLLIEKNNIISSNKQSLDQSIKSVSLLENDKKSLQTKLDDINFSTNDMTVSLKKELDLSHTTNEELKNKLTNSAIYTEELERTLKDNKTSLDKYKESLSLAKDEAKKNLEAVENKLSNAEINIKKLSSESSNNNKKLEEYRTTIEKNKVISRENSLLHNEIKLKLDNVEKKNTQLQADVNRLTSKLASRSKKLSSLESIELNYNNLVSKENKKSHLEDTIHSLEKEKLLLAKNLKSSLEANNKQEIQLEETKKELKTLASLRTDISSLKKENSQLLKKNTKIKSKVEESTNTQDELLRYKDYLSQSEKRWAANNQNLSVELKTYKLRTDKEISQSKEKYQHSINQLTNELVSLRRDNTKQESTIKKLESTLSEKNNRKGNQEIIIKQHSKSTPTEKKSKSLFTDKALTPPKITVHVNKLNTASDKDEIKNNALLSQPKDKESIHKKQSRLPIETIEGIGTVYGKRLRNINVNFIDTLLSKGKTPSGRNSLAQRTDINESLITTWVQNADLLRLDGLTPNHAELLDASHIHNIQTLGKQEQSALYQLISTTNQEKSLSPDIPSKEQLGSWINRAKKLETKVNYNPKPEKQVSPESKAKPTKQPKDTLTLIKGIGSVNEAVLHKLGITTFQQIAAFNKEDEVRIGSKLSSFHDRIAVENWAGQAKTLMGINKK